MAKALIQDVFTIFQFKLDFVSNYLFICIDYNCIIKAPTL